MIKQIVQHSAKLLEFLVLLQLSLSRPQYRHVVRLADVVIVSDAPHKTLSSLYQLIVEAPDASNAADCLRISPWQAADLRQPLREFTLRDLLQVTSTLADEALFISIDDSLTAKDKDTRHLEPVSWHHDHTKRGGGKTAYTNGTVHLEVRIQRGDRAYVYDWALYLREKTVRRLNRRRAAAQRLRYRSKYNLVRPILADLKRQLPTGVPVYVLFDSWYASAKLITYCRRQQWHVICALKSNRTLNGVNLSRQNQCLKHQPYTRVYPSATDQRKRPYLVRVLHGRLKNVPQEVCVLISKRHRGDKRPKYFLSTDCSLSAQAILSFYSKRWPVEVDNFYVKQLLGLGDFRVQSVEAVEKWFAIVFLAYTYLQWRCNHAPPASRLKSVADVIRLHRQEHAYQLLQAVGKLAIESQDMTQVIERFIRQPDSVVT